jgi:hypothetical protein
VLVSMVVLLSFQSSLLRSLSFLFFSRKPFLTVRVSPFSRDGQKEKETDSRIPFLAT